MNRFWVTLCSGLIAAPLLLAEPTEAELLEALRQNPSDSWALYNLGLLRYLEGDYIDSIELLGKLIELDADDWQAREKLIQALSGAGQEERAEEEIAVLKEDWNSGRHEKLVERGFFIRDQFEVGEQRVFVIQYFTLEGKRPLLWKFRWQVDGEDADRWLSLGSYPSTVEIMRRNGDAAVDERAHHLDGYWANGSHATYAFFRGEPDYALIRDMVIEILKGERKSISSTVPAGVDPVE